MLALGAAVPALAAGGPVAVTPGMIDDPSTPWATDNGKGGVTGIGGETGLGSVLKLDVTATDQNAGLFHGWAADARPSESGVTIRQLLDQASYTYTGLNVNLQLPIFFAPKDLAKYGPTGTEAPCMPASAADDAANVCFATLKFEPGPLGGTIDHWQSYRPMDYADAAFGTGPGWWPTQNVGPYGNAVGKRAGLDDLLDAIDSYEVIGLGVAVGSGVQGTGFVSDLAFGGASYRFLPENTKVPPADVPLDTAALTALIADPSADAERFDPGQVSDLSADDLTKVDPAEDLSGSLEWSAADGRVDVFLFSTPKVIARGVPVVQGKVAFSIPKSELAKLSGSHDVVLIGQSTGALRSLPFTLAGSSTPGGGSDDDGGSGDDGSDDDGSTDDGANHDGSDELAETGADAGAALLMGAGAVALIAAGAVLLAARRRGRA